MYDYQFYSDSKNQADPPTGITIVSKLDRIPCFRISNGEYGKRSLLAKVELAMVAHALTS